MKKLLLILVFALLVLPLVTAQELFDLAGAYESYWQWFDLAVWIILFTSLAQYVFVQRMNMHKGIAAGIGIALGLSMLMLEVYGGFRLIVLAPYAAIVVAFTLWTFLWHLLRVWIGEEHQLWTGIISFLLSLMMLTVMLETAGSAGLAMGYLQGLLSFLQQIKGLLIMLCIFGVFGSLVAWGLKFVPGRAAGGGAAPPPEVTKRDLQTVRDDVQKMGNQLRTEMDLKLGELGTRLNIVEKNLKSLSERVDAVEKMLRDVQNDLKEIQDTCVDLAGDVAKQGKLVDKHEDWLLKLRDYIPKLKDSVQKAIKSLKDQIEGSRNDFSELKTRVDGMGAAYKTTKDQLDKVAADIARVEKADAAQAAALKHEQEQLRVKLADLESISSGQIASVVQKIDSAQKEIESLQNQLTESGVAFAGRLDSLENKISADVLAAPERIQAVENGLKEASLLAQDARKDAATAQNALKMQAVHVDRLERAMADISFMLQHAEADVKAMQERLVALGGRLNEFQVIAEEKEKEGLRQGEEITKQSRANVVEIINSLSMLSEALGRLKKVTEGITNRSIAKIRGGKDATAALKEFDLMARVTRRQIKHVYDRLALFINENKNIVMATPEAKKGLVDLLAMESGLLKLEQEMLVLLDTSVSDIKKRIPEIELQPQPAEKLQEEMRKMVLAIHQKLDEYIALVAAKKADIESRRKAGVFP